jgi:2,4-dienoyl-CoA reductase-like NADH-dependent reductase (Old Yellow Enzyme family)/thioredoxin reductase
MKDLLFEPIQIGSMTLKNRIYMPAMHLNMAQNFEVTDQLVEFYAERARGGAGAIVVGYSTVDELSGNFSNIGAHKDEYIPGLKRLADAIKNNGSKAAVQLNHAGRYNFSFFLNGTLPVAPSAVASRLTKETPREITLEEIEGVIESFAQAAARVKEAGYDFVEILSGTGYLISEFLSEITNLREDEYGGSFENRMRFGLEIARRIKKAVGDDYPLVFRVNGNDFMPNGLGRKNMQIYAKKLVEVGVDGLCINVGWHEARVPQIVTGVPRGAFAYLARGIKELVDVPVIASHRINTPRIAREMLADNMCDMVAMGRALIADPFLPQKASEGQENEIIHCVACAQGCFDNLFKMKAVECLCNPRAGYEKSRELKPAEKKKKVMVIGGGAAGMSAAVAAADRGHQVTMYEKSKTLGGQLILAGSPPGRSEFIQLASDLANQLAPAGVNLMLDTEVTEQLIDSEKPDAVILATGAKPLGLPIPGVDLPHVVQAWDVLDGKSFAGQQVVIIGGGAVGVETAHMLAEKGTISGETLKFLLVNQAEPLEDLYQLAIKGTKDITIIEMIEKIGKDIGKSTKWCMLQDVDRLGVKMLTATKAMEITENSVKVDVDGETKELPADTVILAVGSKSYNPLAKMLEGKGIEVEVVGDALKVAKAFDAIHQGYAAALKV